MRGHVQQRGATSWRIKAYVGRDDTGRKRYVTKTIRGTRREADGELARLIVEVDEGRHMGAPPITVNELLDRWLRGKQHNVEPSTIRSYTWLATTYLRPAIGHRKLAALRPMELDQLYASLRESGLSSRTVRMCHTVMRQALEQARRWGLIARSPAVDATPPTQSRHQVTPPTVAQVRMLLEAARQEDPDFHAYLFVLAATGCRRGEGCALRWSDVDVERGQLTIQRSIAMNGSKPYEKGTKTHQARRISLDPASIAVLRDHRRRIRERYLANGTHVPDDFPVFADRFGHPWRPDVCTNRFSRLRAQVGLESVRLHDLRHFVATMLGDGGMPIATISSRLGHRDTATTLNIYTHAIPATDQHAAAYLGKLLAPPN
jgi:integrase